MIRINSNQRKALEDKGYLKHKKVRKGIVIQEPNFYISSKTHKSRAKTCYVVEEPRIMKFLNNFDVVEVNNFRHNNFKKNNRKTKVV